MAESFTYDVFLSHNQADKPRVRRLAERLRAAGLRVWFDEWIIGPGDNIVLAIEHGLEASRTLVLCLSRAALRSGWVGLERTTAIFRDPVNAGRRFIPLLVADCKLPDALRIYKHIDYRKESKAAFRKLLQVTGKRFNAAYSPLRTPLASGSLGRTHASNSTQSSRKSRMKKHHSRTSVPKPVMKSSPEFGDDLLSQLEDVARTSVVIGGVAAMPYYRSSLRANERGDDVNPTTEADVRGTVAMVQYLETEMRKITQAFTIWGEELSDKSKDPSLTERIRKALPRQNNTVRTLREFTQAFNGRVCILIDALDGTRNFDSGMPPFCSAMAMFLDGDLKIGAVYDPIHHTVMYGCLGYQKEPLAFEWAVAAGQRSPLLPNPADLTVAMHLPSEDQEAREITLKVCRHLADAPKPTRAKRIYMLNSGQMALAMVARGQIAAFCNPTTNPWDVAAGEVLVRAAGGHVTDFQNVPIDYTRSFRVQVLAAANAHFHRTVREAIKASPYVHRGDSRT